MEYELKEKDKIKVRKEWKLERKCWKMNRQWEFFTEVKLRTRWKAQPEFWNNFRVYSSPSTQILTYYCEIWHDSFI